MKENRKEKKKGKTCGWPELGGLAEVLPPPEVLVVLTAVEKEGKKDENGDLLSDRIEGDFLTW